MMSVTSTLNHNCGNCDEPIPAGTCFEEVVGEPWCPKCTKGDKLTIIFPKDATPADRYFIMGQIAMAIHQGETAGATPYIWHLKGGE